MNAYEAMKLGALALRETAKRYSHDVYSDAVYMTGKEQCLKAAALLEQLAGETTSLNLSEADIPATTADK